VQYEGEAGEAFLQGQGEVGEGVNRKVLPQWWGGGFRPPVKGEVDRGEAYCEVPGRVLGPGGGEGGEGLWESCRGRVGIRGGAGNPECGQAPPVPAVGYDRGEEGLAC